MQKILKINPITKKCNAALNASITPPVVHTSSFSCGEELVVSVDAFNQAGLTLKSIVWTLTIYLNMKDEIGPNTLSYVATVIEGPPDQPIVFFPKELFTEGCACRVSVYFVTDQGESAASNTAIISVGFNDTAFYTKETTVCTDPSKEETIIQNIGADLYALTFLNDPKSFVIGHKSLTAIDGVYTTLGSYTGGAANPIVPGIVNANNGRDFKTGVICTDGTDLYFIVSIVEEVDYVPHLISINLVKFIVATKTFETLCSDNTGLFKRDMPGMCYREGALYFLGGHRVDVNSKAIEPLDDERTFLKFDLTTKQFSEVPVVGTLKPKNYRDWKLIEDPISGNLIAFGGRGTPIHSINLETYNNEMWEFSFKTMRWSWVTSLPRPEWLDRSMFDMSFSVTQPCILLVVTRSLTAEELDRHRMFYWKYWPDTHKWELVFVSPRFRTNTLRDMRIVAYNGEHIVIKAYEGEMN